MPPSYPGAVKSFDAVSDDVTVWNANQVDQIHDEIEAMEDKLWSGGHPTFANLTITGGINVGSASGAGAGAIRASSLSNSGRILLAGSNAQIVDTTSEGTLHKRTSATNSVQGHFATDLESTGTPAAGLGSRWYSRVHSSNNTMRTQFQLLGSWVVATDASRTARLSIRVADSGSDNREVLRGEASGSAPMIGFLGANAITRPTVTGSRGGNAALASLLTALANLGLITNNTS